MCEVAFLLVLRGGGKTDAAALAFTP